MRTLHKNKKQNLMNGFTLVELAIVIVMIGLTSIATMRLMSVYKNSKKISSDTELMRTNAHGVFRAMTQQPSIVFTNPHVSVDYPYPYLRQIDGASSITDRNPDLKNKDGKAFTYLPAYELTRNAHNTSKTDICEYTSKTSLSIKYCLDSSCTKYKVIDDVGLIIAPNDPQYINYVKYNNSNSLPLSAYESGAKIEYTVTKSGLSDSSFGSDSTFIEPKEIVYFTLAELHERFNCLSLAERGSTTVYKTTAALKEDPLSQTDITYIDLKVFGNGDYCIESHSSMTGHKITTNKPNSSPTSANMANPGECTNPYSANYQRVWHTIGQNDVIYLYSPRGYSASADPDFFKVPTIEVNIYSKRIGDSSLEDMALTISAADLPDYADWLPVKKKTILVPLVVHSYTP